VSACRLVPSWFCAPRLHSMRSYQGRAVAECGLGAWGSPNRPCDAVLIRAHASALGAPAASAALPRPPHGRRCSTCGIYERALTVIVFRRDVSDGQWRGDAYLGAGRARGALTAASRSPAVFQLRRRGGPAGACPIFSFSHAIPSARCFGVTASALRGARP
jgi:hypothetical protein